MYRKSLADKECSIARALDVVGEWWTLLILRDAFRGVHRFDDFLASLGIARNVLSARLAWLVEEGILEKRAYQQRPARHEYFLTDKGLDLWPVMISMLRWGDKHVPDTDGPPMLVRHKGCDGLVDERGTCESCGARLEARDAYTEYGPGASAELRDAA